MNTPNPDPGDQKPPISGPAAQDYDIVFFEADFSQGWADGKVRRKNPDSPPGGRFPRLRLPPREETLRDLPRITFDPDKWTGLACIEGVRVGVATILRCLASGKTVQEILAAYPGLQADDVRQAVEYAARQVEIPVIPP